MGGAVRVTLERDRRHGHYWSGSQALFERVVLLFAFGQPQPPAVVVHDDSNVIGVVERRRASIERCVVELPLRRGELPDQFGEVVPVLVVALAATLGSKVILVPPFPLRGRRQRSLAGRLAPDEVSAHGHDPPTALRP